jgi:hypothetical protein
MNTTSFKPITNLSCILIKQSLLVVFLLMSFRIIEKTPLRFSYYLLEPLFLIVLLAFLFILIFHSLLNYQSFSFLEIFIVSLLLIPFYSAWLSFIEFDQPFIYGLLAERKWFLVISGLMLLHLLKTRKINLNDIERSFLTIAWLSLIAFMLMINILDPENYLDIEGFIVYSELRGGYRFKLSPIFIVFAVIYYFIRYFHTKKIRNILFFSVFLGYIVYIQQGRTLTISLLIVLTLYVFFNLKLKDKLVLTFYSIVLVTIVLYISLALNQIFIERTTLLYSNVLLFLQGMETGEPGVDIRLALVALTLNILLSDWKYLLFGIGRLSNQWNEGFGGIFDYFYPADIGIIGVIFLYGLIGLFYVNMQYILSFIYYRRIHLMKNNIFLKSIVYFLIAYFIKSMVTGQTFSSPSCSVIIIVIIYYFHYQEKQKKTVIDRNRI